MLLDRVITDAEREGTKDTERAAVRAWIETLTLPPVSGISDLAASARVIGVFMADTVTRASAAHRGGVTAVADDEGVPQGWDNASLLVEMKRSMGRA